MNNIVRKIGLVSIATFFALSFVGLSIVSASTQQKPEFLLSINISCLNYAFCGNSEYIEVVGATAFWGGHQNTGINVDFLNAKGHVAGSVSTIWVGTWKVGSDGNFVTSGVNVTTFTIGSHSMTTTQKFKNYDTMTPAMPIVLNCKQFFGMPCPAGVKAEMTVTAVPK